MLGRDGELLGATVAGLFRGQVLQSCIWSSFFHPLEPSAHRRIVHSQILRDLVERIAKLLVRQNDLSIVVSL